MSPLQRLEERGISYEPSDDLAALVNALDSYITAVLDFFDGSVDKSILRPAAGMRQEQQARE